ncbi:ATP-binding cassette domain-containing protein [Micromonospora sp. WMMD1102]|uniref:ATP-binding cassette domain-containing protein n=1 Tax=Micromonospora sp. WMMD1102 TaxID=3016105 RepID=UPI00241577B5|nr:ATP-binding cassette domain-containing protein [Micromonospora sp. WMMD1102]MDG4789446.1 ATP-binding cassette domain-containing protein [Micromonospora sp. WMMD1102]
MLELHDIVKVYRGGHRAVDGVTLRLGPGLLGLLGPNGAGKSSLIRIAATVTRPTSGRVSFDGADVLARPDRLRRVLGYLPQDFGVYPQLTAREFLGFLAAAKGLPARTARTRVDELLELVNLSSAARRPLGGYSGGMLRRVGIAQTLLADPRVIVVDEPTAGLDPEERVRFRNLLGELAVDRVVVLSTHIVPDIESVAHRIVVVAQGRTRRQGSPEELLRATDGRVWELLADPAEVPRIQARHLVSRLVRTSFGVRVRLLSAQSPGPAASPVPPDLEDAYLDAVHQPTLSTADDPPAGHDRRAGDDPPAGHDRRAGGGGPTGPDDRSTGPHPHGGHQTWPVPR